MKNIVRLFFAHLTKHLLSTYSVSEWMSGSQKYSGKQDMIRFLMWLISQGKQDIKE